MRKLLITIAALVFGATAQAQTVTNGQTFGNWTVNCSATGVGETACVLAQRILRSEDRAFIAEILAMQSRDGAKTFLAARVPVGVYLPAGFAMRATDSDDVTTFIWQTCGSELCEAIVEIEPETLATLAREDQVVLGAFKPNLQSENFVFRFSLAGAVEGLAALQAAKP